MEADCSSSSCPQKDFPGHQFLVAITRESLTLSFRKKLSSMSRSNNWTEKQTVILPSVGSDVHQDTDIRYLSNDSFRSSTAFNREDCPFGVSFNKFDNRRKQIVFFW